MLVRLGITFIIFLISAWKSQFKTAGNNGSNGISSSRSDIDSFAASYSQKSTRVGNKFKSREKVVGLTTHRFLSCFIPLTHNSPIVIPAL